MWPLLVHVRDRQVTAQTLMRSRNDTTMNAIVRNHQSTDKGTNMNMRRQQLLLLTLAVGIASPMTARSEGWIEPNAGHWRTWVISSGVDFRVPPPPTQSETRSELGALAGLLSHNDAKVQDQIEYWDAGAPSYRWI